jgi:hypothetical protein
MKQSSSENAGKQLIAIALMIGLSACALISKQQSIDVDVNHWTCFVFSAGTAAATLKIPPDFRTFNSKLPEFAYSKRSQRATCHLHRAQSALNIDSVIR